MREYEIMVIYDLALAEAEGSDAAEKHLTALLEQHGGKVNLMDHWGRRRMAYRINKQMDGDYIVVRADLDPSQVNPIQAALRINERVFRWMVVRGDELPPLTLSRPVPPRAEQAPAPAEAATPAAAPEAEAAPAATEPAATDAAGEAKTETES